ncbi:MAG: hypothetical protein WDK96_00145 [Candidatus Paceibacterota bacterium]
MRRKSNKKLIGFNEFQIKAENGGVRLAILKLESRLRKDVFNNFSIGELVDFYLMDLETRTKEAIVRAISKKQKTDFATILVKNGHYESVMNIILPILLKKDREFLHFICEKEIKSETRDIIVREMFSEAQKRGGSNYIIKIKTA